MNKWQAAILIFLVALLLRLATINQMGKTWDEVAYVETGHKFVELFNKGDFKDPFWYEKSDHPPLARYIYGFAQSLDRNNKFTNEKIEFPYDYTLPRIISSILGSLTVFFIVFLGYKYFTPFIGIISGIIFAFLPFFVGLSQLATLESFVMLFFTGNIYFFIQSLETSRNSKVYIVLSGIFLGLSILTKQSSIIGIPLMVLIFFTFAFFNKNNIALLKDKFRTIIYICVVAFFTFFVLWPSPFFHPLEFWHVQQTMWIDNVKLPPPEVFFGRLMLVPFPYYFVMFLITTPIVTLVLFAIGLISLDRKKSFIGLTIIVWFLFSFLQTFYPFKQHGVRYIIQIYAPFALICGIGFNYLFKNFFSQKLKFVGIIFLIFYFSLILIKQSPYYLDYFNEVVGGTNNVYQKKLFQLGWWGQGIGEAATYISRNEAEKVTVAIDDPISVLVMPKFNNMEVFEYKEKKDADYIIVPYFNIVRLRFPVWEVEGDYSVKYIVYAGKAELVKVYKRKNN